LYVHAKRTLARHGIKAGIVALGAVTAVASLDHSTTYLSREPLVQQVAAGDSIASQKMNALIASATPNPTVVAAPVARLDLDVQNPKVDYWVKKLSTSMSGSVEIALGRMTKYYDMITTKLAAKQMPRDLVYLAMIESDFDPNARSHARAVGLWQFMATTARRFGLEVRGHVDERKDPERATDAALDYLATLHDRFGSWYLAAAAYNSGEGTVSRALKRVTGKRTGTDADFFKILKALPRETQDYVPKLIAAARIGNAPAEYGILPRGISSSATRAAD
jgi:membrane-bound lytic murein transglycosylase D